MIVSVIYDDVVKAVEQEIHLPYGWLLHSKTEDATDARYILCGLLHCCGLSSYHIQNVTGLKKSTVNKILASYKERLDRRKIAKIWWLQIERKLTTIMEGDNTVHDYLCGDQITYSLTNNQN